MPFFAKNRPRLVTTGGTITYLGWDKIHTFTSNGTFTCNGTGYIQYLIVGGGVGGCNGLYYLYSGSGPSGDGGNGGEVLYKSLYKVSAGSFEVVVAEQGIHSWYPNQPAAAKSSSIFSIIAHGGLRNSYGAAGGLGRQTGGAGNPGALGTTCSISGTAVVYGSGGGGGAWADTSGTYAGGSGGTGAGKGGDVSGTNALDGSGATNYGGGGGGGGCILHGTDLYGTGGDTVKGGVVIIRYRRV